MNTLSHTTPSDPSVYDSILTSVPGGEYLQASRDGTFIDGQTLALFRKCPLSFKLKTDGELEWEDYTDYDFVHAARCLILEGPAAFATKYMVSDGPLDDDGLPRSKFHPRYIEWLSKQSKPVVSTENFQTIMKMRDSIVAHEGAKILLSEGRPDSTIRMVYEDVPCQVHLDWFSEWHGIVELVICDKLDYYASSLSFDDDHKRSLALQRAMLSAAGGAEVPVSIIAVEKKAPYRCGVWSVDVELLDKLSLENEQTLAKLRSSIDDNVWPSGFEETRYISSR